MDIQSKTPVTNWLALGGGAVGHGHGHGHGEGVDRLLDWVRWAYTGGRLWRCNSGKVEELTAVEIAKWRVGTEEIIDCYLRHVVFVRVEEEGTG